MQPNRRQWLQQIGLGTLALGLSSLESFAAPANNEGKIRSLAPSDVIRLSSNENPYGPSPMARSAMIENMMKSNRYNWDITSELMKAIADKNNLPGENILVTAGSTEILNLLAVYYSMQKGNFVIADPSFTNWTNIAVQQGLTKIAVPLDENKRNDLDAMQSKITGETRFVYICNPNNPTATIVDATKLRDFIREAAKKTMVVVDEAYLEFTEEPSVCDMVKDIKNLIVIRTFSKIYGMAGARVGYAMAHPDTIDALLKLKVWPNGDISVMSRVGAMAALKDKDFFNDCNIKNNAARAYTVSQLQSKGLHCIPSYTNFIYFSLKEYEHDFFDVLKINKIQGTGIYEQEGKWTRITVGTMEEMQRFISVI